MREFAFVPADVGDRRARVFLLQTNRNQRRRLDSRVDRADGRRRLRRLNVVVVRVAMDRNGRTLSVLEDLRLVLIVVVRDILVVFDVVLLTVRVQTVAVVVLTTRSRVVFRVAQARAVGRSLQRRGSVGIRGCQWNTWRRDVTAAVDGHESRGGYHARLVVHVVLLTVQVDLVAAVTSLRELQSRSTVDGFRALAFVAQCGHLLVDVVVFEHVRRFVEFDFARFQMIAAGLSGALVQQVGARVRARFGQ